MNKNTLHMQVFKNELETLLASSDAEEAPAMLAFWGRNMAPIRARGRIWPGFDYSAAEWKRLLTLANAVPTAAFIIFGIATAALMVAAVMASAGVIRICVQAMASAICIDGVEMSSLRVWG